MVRIRRFVAQLLDIYTRLVSMNMARRTTMLPSVQEILTFCIFVHT